MVLEYLTGPWSGTDTQPSSETLPMTGRLVGEQILVPLLTQEVTTLTTQIEAATMLAEANDATTVHVVKPVTVPEQTPNSLRHRLTTEDDELLNWAIAEVNESIDQVEGSFSYGRRLSSAISRAIATENIDTVILPSDSARSLLRGEVTHRIATEIDCDVITMDGRPNPGSFLSVLLPIAGGPHSGLAVDVATRIARRNDAWIDILHVFDSGRPDHRRTRIENYLEAAYHRVARLENTTTWLLEADDPTAAIIEQSRYYDLTVLGAPTKGRLRRFVQGSTNRSVRANAGNTVLSVRNNTDVR